jgi:very-short-patch-repair endonuclease
MVQNRPGIGSTEVARRLRKRPTDAEQAMWRLLREAFPEARFRRQVPLLRFYADFASHRYRVVIEVDGGQHGEAADRERDHLMRAEGYEILRFWNNDVLENREGVARVIAEALERRS